MKIVFTTESLKTMTDQQRDAICYLAGPHSTLVDVKQGTSDLPAGYLTFWVTYNNGNKVYGGISPEGSVST